MLGARGRLVGLSFLVWLGAAVQVNAPGLLVGYGLVSLGVGLAVLFLPPVGALAAVLAGHALALPVVVLSGSMFPVVALLGLLVRPPVAWLAARLDAGRGWPGPVVYAALSGFLTSLIAVLYYGDDGIHASLASHDLAPALLAVAVHRLYSWDSRAGLLGLAVAGLLVASMRFYASPAGLPLLAGLLAALALQRRGGPPRLAAAAMLAGLALSPLAGGALLARNLALLSYPFHPSSYTPDRWNGSCAGWTGSLLRGVHTPERLRIVSPCTSIEGTIGAIPYVADDGDYCMDIRVESSNTTEPASLGSLVLRHGMIHAEIVPRDRALLESVGGMLCRGDRVRVVGPLVVDTDHGMWAEIHPVMGIQLVERGPGPCVSLGEARGG